MAIKNRAIEAFKQGKSELELELEAMPNKAARRRILADFEKLDAELELVKKQKESTTALYHKALERVEFLTSMLRNARLALGWPLP